MMYHGLHFSNENLWALLSRIVLCGFITDVSPLSTLGAIFIANATEDQNKKKLFRDTLIGGLAMSPVEAIVSFYFHCAENSIRCLW
jgi:cytochrome bd-type quinol oxidase subunit 2